VPTNRQQELRGTGANTHVFWVTTNLLSDWIQLPEVSPEHLIVAREIKHVFSGNLNSTIDSCPPFPGKERHLLRATLARITHATELCPKGMYEIDEET
jgi:radial spoke head protein 4A